MNTNLNKLDKVCIIDDDIIYQFLIKEEIEETRMVNSVLFFDDGEQALHFIQQKIASQSQKELPDVIFLDINMPVMNGWEFIQAYVGMKPFIGKKITIYMVSSSIDNRDLDKAKSISEISDYIIKPITSNRLQTIFKGLLA
ncbi:MAG: response regulator [Chitinophagaceae bacterium]